MTFPTTSDRQKKKAKISYSVKTMFEENCRKCRGQFVHILNLQSLDNYRMCPNLYNILQTSFTKDGSRIYCGSPNQQSKIPPGKVKPDHCIFCNQKLVKMAQVVGMKHFEVCPAAFGIFLYAYKTEQRGRTTKIYCETKIEVKKSNRATD